MKNADLRNWELARQWRAKMENAYREMLAQAHGEFPYEAAGDFHALLGWDNAMVDMLAARPSELELRLGPKTCQLLPELSPVADGQWLDRKQPIYRTVLGGLERHAPQRAGMSVAILYQDTEGKLFETLAYRLIDKLPSIEVDLFPGHELKGASRADQLVDIFLRQRAVLFLGHLQRPKDGKAGGWQLTDKEGDCLPFETIIDLLRLPESRARTKGAEPLFVPELIFTGCCCGAWGAPHASDADDFFYPRKFLEGGVRFFVGSWMDLVYPDLHLDALQSVLEGFLTRWLHDVDSAPRALFEAKQDCKNQAFASLFQLYVAPERSGTAEIPRGPVTGNLQAGAHLGDYTLGPELWRDAFGTAFWAEQEAGASPHIIQVLADGWQGDPEVIAKVRTAIDKLEKAHLPSSHLVPDEVRQLDCGNGRTLLALLYRRPPGETAEMWSKLSGPIAEPGVANPLASVLERGAEISSRLAELHACQLHHGNFDPSVVLFRAEEGGRRVVIKDAWAQWVQPGGCPDARYVAPDAKSGEDLQFRQKMDCFGLGVLLFEMAVGRPLRASETSVRSVAEGRGDWIPKRESEEQKVALGRLEALESVVLGCLAPSAVFRPAADEVARRLIAALPAGGTYLTSLGADLDLQILAGHRLIVVYADRLENLQNVLAAMQYDPSAHFSYHLYVAAEGEGLVEQRSGSRPLPWTGGEARRLELSYRYGVDPGQEYVNAERLFDWIRTISSSAPASGARQQMPIVLIKGGSWWKPPFLDDEMRFWRILRSCQDERKSPVIVIADRALSLPPDLARSFLVCTFPGPTPGELFETVLSAPASLGCPALTPESAMELAERLYPCSSLELEQSLKLCASRHRCIDENVVAIRDDARAQHFRSLGTISYTPPGRLPHFDWFGWPPYLEPRLRAWAKAVGDGKVVFRRLLFTASSGHGKTAAARSLAYGLKLPLLRLDVFACLKPNLGQSEQALAESLRVIDELGGACVLIDGLDGLAEAEGSAADAMFARMASRLMQWIDRLPPQIVLVATATKGDKLPAAWRRRFEMTIDLDTPTLQGEGEASLEYRRSVLAALFRRFQIAELAANQALLTKLAAETLPARRKAPLMSAIARVNPTGPLRDFSVTLGSGNELEAWMAETLLLHTPPEDLGAPHLEKFWLDAVL